MSCCTIPNDPKGIAVMCFRITFGVALAIVGLVHYLTIADFAPDVAKGLGSLSLLGTLWAYILPALQIVGGVLIAAKKQPVVAAWTTGVALGSIAIGMPLKSVLGGAPLPEMMMASQNALFWLLFFILIMKFSCCGHCKKDGGEQHG